MVLEVRALSTGDGLSQDVSFSLRKGEILGFAGLMGAGRTEVARADLRRRSHRFGRDLRQRKARGDQEPGRRGAAWDRLSLRKTASATGSCSTSTWRPTRSLATLQRFTRRAGMGAKEQGAPRSRKRYVEQLGVKTPGVEQRVRYLSGGNQQKVVLAKWLAKDCDILIFDEPTRGIDVGAKGEIYKLLNDLTARQGKSVIMISSELPEILRMSHRIIVMCEGRITGELVAHEATEERIMRLATWRRKLARAVV